MSLYVKRLVLAAIAAATLTGCGGAAPPTPASDMQIKADTYAIDQIEATWHKASSTKDVDLMMSLWADNATATLGGTPYVGKDQIRQFFATKSGPFKPENTWLSDTPAYKIRVTVDGDKGTLYFECHYVDANPQSPTYKQVVAVVSADQNVQRINGKWLITNLVSASPQLTP